MNPNDPNNQAPITPQSPPPTAAPVQQNPAVRPEALQNTGSTSRPIEYSSRIDRFVAYIVDGLYILVLFIGIWIPGLILGSVFIAGSSEALGGVIIYGTGFVAVFVAYWLVRIRPVVKYGYTLGKKPLHLKVLKEDGSRLSTGAVWGREAALFVANMFYVELIFVLPILFTQKRQGLHDMMVKSIVVKDDPQAVQGGEKSNRGLIIALLAIPGIIIVLGILTALVVTTYSGIQDRAKEAASQDSSSQQ